MITRAEIALKTALEAAPQLPDFYGSEGFDMSRYQAAYFRWWQQRSAALCRAEMDEAEVTSRTLPTQERELVLAGEVA